MTRPLIVLLSCLTLSLARAPAAAQDPVPVLRVGDVLSDGTTVTGFRAVNVDFFGDWLALVTTDEPGVALLRNTFGTGHGVWKKLGSPVGFPAGATVGAFDAVSTDLFGNVIWNTRLAGTPGGAADDMAVFMGNSLWFQEGPADPPSVVSPLPPGSRWLSFDDVRIASGDGFFLLRGRHDDPTLAGPSESFLVRGVAAGSPTILGQAERLIAAGQVAPGLGVRLEDIRLEPGAAAISPNSRWALWAGDLRGPESRDGVLYRYNANAGVHLLIAREGQASTVGGLPWGPLESVAVDVASSGRWILRATVRDGADELPVLFDTFQELARVGDPAPGLAPAVYADFGRGAPLLDDLGHRVWYARVEEAGVARDVLYVDGVPLVEAGATRIGGRTVVGLDGAQDKLSLGPSNGRLVFVATLDGGEQGAYLIDLDG